MSSKSDQEVLISLADGQETSVSFQQVDNHFKESQYYSEKSGLYE